MSVKDVNHNDDLIDIIARFYDSILKDPIIGFIFTDVVKIELEHHLPIIVDFWADVLFVESSADLSQPINKKRYTGNTLQKHLDINQKLALKPGHFTRWLHLFDLAVDDRHAGPNAEAMKKRAEVVAKSISAAIVKQKRGDINLALNSKLDR